MSEGLLASNSEPEGISFNRTHKRKKSAIIQEKSRTSAPSPAQPWLGPFFSTGSALQGHFGGCSRRSKVRKNRFLRSHWSQKAQKEASQVRACHPVKIFIPGAPYLPAASPEAGKTCCRDGDAGSHRASAAITMAHHLASAAYNRPALLKASLLRHSTNILGAYRGTRTGALGSSEDKSITLRRQSSPRKMLALFGTCLQRARF